MVSFARVGRVNVSEWEPATDAERAMRDALRTDDQESYFRILAGVDLLLPVSADALAGLAPLGWGTWSTGGRTHVLAFTSPSALQACLADYTGSARRVAYGELADTWPNLEWWLAVNPGLPIEGYLPAWFVAQLSRGDVRLPKRGPGREGQDVKAAAMAAPGASQQGGPMPPGASGVPGTAAADAGFRPGGSFPPDQGRVPGAAAAMGSRAAAAASGYAPVGGVSGPPQGYAPGGRPTSAPGNAPTSGRANAPTSGPANAPTSGPASGLANAPTSGPASGPPNAPTSDPASGLANAPTSGPASGPANAPAGAPTSGPGARPMSEPGAGGLAASANAPASGAPVRDAGDRAPAGNSQIGPGGLPIRTPGAVLPSGLPSRVPASAEPGQSATPPGDAPGSVPAAYRAPSVPGPSNLAAAAGSVAAVRGVQTPPQDPGAQSALPTRTPPVQGSTADALPRRQPATPAGPPPSHPGFVPPVVPGTPGTDRPAREQQRPEPQRTEPQRTEPQRTEPQQAQAQKAEPPQAEAIPDDDDFVAANSTERDLLAAADGGSTDSFLSTLLLATVLIPVADNSRPGSSPGESGFVFRTEEMDGGTFLVVFTSRDRLAEHYHEPARTVAAKFLELIRNWPDPSWSFAVNPGSPIGAKYPGAQVIALANWATEAGLGTDPDEREREEKPAQLPQRATDTASHATVMQKTVPTDQVDYYLERGYDRVAGFVHRANEVEHLRTPAELFAALGLVHEGTSYTADAKEAYVLRWPAFRPSLYRIPYGGQSEQALRAMDGWVIERPPFRGNGFAPGESRDVIAEFKVDSVRLPHGAQLWRMDADGTERCIAIFDADSPTWRKVGEQ